MNLTRTQTFLAKLYTSRDFLALYQNAPEKAFDLLKLDAAERQFFLQADGRRIEKIASIIRDKQQDALESCFPLFSTYFPSAFTTCSERFSHLEKNYSPSYRGKARLSEDFHDFCRDALPALDIQERAFLIELIRYEHLQLKIGQQTLSRSHQFLDRLAPKTITPYTCFFLHDTAHIEEFNYPLSQLIQAFEEGHTPALTPEKTTLIFMPADLPYPAIITFPAAWRPLLEFFDGNHSYASLAQRLPQDLLAQLPEALALLKTHKILTFV